MQLAARILNTFTYGTKTITVITTVLNPRTKLSRMHNTSPGDHISLSFITRGLQICDDNMEVKIVDGY